MTGSIRAMFVGGPKAGQMVALRGPVYRLPLLQPVTPSVVDYVRGHPDPDRSITCDTLVFTARQLAFGGSRWWVLVPEDWSEDQAFHHIMTGNVRTHCEPAG